MGQQRRNRIVGPLQCIGSRLVGSVTKKGMILLGSFEGRVLRWHRREQHRGPTVMYVGGAAGDSRIEVRNGIAGLVQCGGGC